MMDENRMRLRASCNACNESKVRCSQRKPTCTRCERNGTECIYGLSRRTHKDAPPISIPPSQRGGRLSRPGRPPRLPPNGDTRTSTSTKSNSTSNTATQFNGCAMPDESAEAHSNNANLLADYMFPMATETDSMHRPAQLLDFSSLVTDSTSSTAMAPGHFSTTGAEYANPKPWVLGSLFGANHNSDATDMGTCWALNGEGECTCHAGVTELLASMRRGGSSNDQRLSLDTQLAELKQCIVSSETSMGCAHGREDSEPIHIMAVAMLIGYVIDDFKMLASESSPRRSSSLSSAAAAAEMATLGNAERGSKSMFGRVATPSSTNMSLGGLMEPRLSWGVLELEEDDEMDLRQRLYLLSFRKLERLLSQLTLYLRDLHNAWAGLPDPSRHTAFVIACDYTRLWLEKKAGDVKRLFSVPARDETMDSTLA
jgi:Fungal Zn(2)-Cys(6) binuclear cluster domain